MSPPVAAPASAPQAQRLASLDALRGFDMFWIIGADAIGAAVAKLAGGPAVHFLAGQLDHAPWEGFRFYDLIFPLFVFMVGAAVPLSMDRMLSTEGRSAALVRILKRTLLLYVLGLFYYGGLSTPLGDIRLLGVLQRIALCYGITSLLYLHLRPRNLVITAAGILLGYWALLRWVPVPGFGPGDFAEGHNLTNWFDSQFLPLRKYDGTHDPEGILSTLPAIASCLGGVLACLWLRDEKLTAARRSAGLVGAGLLLVALGWLWGMEFPVIKKLWSSSFVLVAGGWSCVLLGCFHYLIDVRQWKSWALPLIWVGCNPLAIYLISNILDFNALAARFVGGDISHFLDGLWPGFGGLALALVGSLICFGICGFLHQRKIFLRL